MEPSTEQPAKRCLYATFFYLIVSRAFMSCFMYFAGSADRTVKFWDLETFEPIGSAGPEV